MQDDVTPRASAPFESHNDAWQSRSSHASHDEAPRTSEQVRVGLTAVVLSVRAEQPVVLATAAESSDAAEWRLPETRFSPATQCSLETAVRESVHATTGRDLGYLEQLLTDYGPLDQTGHETRASASQLSISYLALARSDTQALAKSARWLDCYELLPWEDFRGGRPSVLASHILPGLDAWCAKATGEAEPHEAAAVETPMSRRERVAVSFGLSGRSWDDQRVVDRFDLLLEAGLVQPTGPTSQVVPSHLRLIAAGLGRLRAKIRYRPVVFELLPPEFTLFELQRTVEAILGPHLHKQNFRRLVETAGLVEQTGEVRSNTGGRPAKLFRFRREVLMERPAPGVRVKVGRA